MVRNSQSNIIYIISWSYMCMKCGVPGMAFVVGVILGAVPLPGLFIYKQALNRKIGVGAPLPYSYTRGCIYLVSDHGREPKK